MHMDDKLEALLHQFISLRDMYLSRGDETPCFSATLFIKGERAGVVLNRGMGGANIYRWEGEFCKKEVQDKICAFAAKLAAAREPKYKELWEKLPTEALTSLIFDLVSIEERKGIPKINPSPVPSPTFKPTFKVGNKVVFGRTRGERTEGRVVKVCRKNVVVESTEARSNYPVGTKFRVDPGLLTLVA